jgi:predicted SnoaL-like aldol condensation-catalyzing enzyme
MSAEENKAVVRRWNDECLSKQRLDDFDKVLDKDYANRSGVESPWATVIQGLDAAKAYFEQAFREEPSWRVTIEDIIAEGDRVAVRLTFHEKGQPSANAIAFYRLTGGKIVDDWFCWNALEK